MRYYLKLRCNNDAFSGDNLGPEIARILRHEADLLEEGPRPISDFATLRDLNGQKVGHAVLTDRY